MSEAGTAGARIVLMTAPGIDEAQALARKLVEERLAACVSLLPGATSVYRWEGEVQEDSEVLMVAKTSAARLVELEARVAELHPYDVPEFVALDPCHVAPAYLAWLVGATA
jgi:periplasmic divalent cation tolerance protein